MAKGLGSALNGATRAKFACGLLLVAWGYAAWPAVLSMIKTYRYSGCDYHGFLILPLCYVLMQQHRATLHRSNLAASTTGLLLLLLCCVLWLFAKITTLTDLEQFALISMLPAIVMTTCGRKVSSILAYPLVCLLLLMPIGQKLFFYSQQFFSWILLKSIALTKLSIYWEQGTIYVSKQNYIVKQLCAPLKYSTLLLTMGIFVAAVFNKSFIKRIIFALSFIVIPYALLYIAILSLMLFSAWQGLATLEAFTIKLITYATVATGALTATLATYKFRQKSKRNYNNDGIDWRNEFTHFSSRWLAPTIMACTMVLLLPVAAKELRSHQHYAKSWNDLTTLEKSKPTAVNLAIKYNNVYKQTAAHDPKTWKEIKSSNIKITVNKAVIPLTETVLVNKYQGKVVWSLRYTNGHLTNNENYSKVLENIYALTKSGAKSAQISLTTDIDSNLNLSRKRLTSSLGELHKAAHKSRSKN